MNGAFNPQFASFQFFYATPCIKSTPTRHTHAMPPTRRPPTLIIIKCAPREHLRVLLNDFTLSPELMIELKWRIWQAAGSDDDVGECTWDMTVDNLFCILQSIFGSCLGNFAIISITRLVTNQRTYSTPLHHNPLPPHILFLLRYYIPPTFRVTAKYC